MADIPTMAGRRGLVPALMLGVVLGGLGGGPAVARPPERPPRRTDPPPVVEESASERRAVRGAPVDGAVAADPGARELRRFEEETFPRSGSPVVPSDHQAAT